MRCLIHVNGPPGIGKSTRAALYSDRHPGTLNLDVDRLHGLVGGWRDPAQDKHTILRPVALAMTRAHLAGGRDVQLLEVAANRAFSRGCVQSVRRGRTHLRVDGAGTG
jgi:hypothetical protein